MILLMYRNSLLLLLASSVCLSHAEDTIRPNRVMRENETLVSANGVFELGFFEDAVSGYVFLGIWFRQIANKKPVWVANRDNPLERFYATFQIRDDGNLIVTDRKQAPVIINYGTVATGWNTSATLLDTGNLVLRQSGQLIWQSFDFPIDTLLPGMRLGWFGLQMKNLQPRRQVLLSWLSPQNPSRGAFTVGTAYKDSRTVAVWRGDLVHKDIGYWDGDVFRFIFNNSFDSFSLSRTSTSNETYLSMSTNGGYDMSWLVIASTGQLDEYAVYRGEVLLVRHDLCDESGAVNASVCLRDASQNCRDGDAFVPVNGTMPSSISLNISIIGDFGDCKLTCQTNCSCVAFAFGEFGCQLYYGSKRDLYNIGGRGVFHVRSNTASRIKQGGKKRRFAIIIAVTASTAPVILAIIVFLCYKQRQKSISRVNQLEDAKDSSSEGEVKLICKTAAAVDIGPTNDIEFIGEGQNLTWFCINTLENATGDFDAKNKLGEGGFGPVYKGKLTSGQEIAVKRLSKRSAQGVKEFRNEIILISRLQHRNLVKLLGCCIHGEEYILVYEYLINRSLDSFIFDESKQMLVDWKMRVQIVEGIAQGILYLHKYSRLRIIHRDLKASNILLDGDMNPKISDFGMARIYEENETRAKTTKIAGTYGYMSPEYAMDGHFSEKSDVFSFGIMVLEIISGNRNIAFFESDHSLNLLGYAWKLWKEGRSNEFLDTTLGKANSCAVSEAAMYVQLGLLCVQERAGDRPDMAEVVAMVSNRMVSLPLPKEPAFLS